MSTSTTTSLSLLILLAFTAGFAEAQPPEPTKESPYVWDCTLAFTDTTCNQMTQAWANDNEIETTDLTIAVECGDCTEREIFDYEGNRHVTGYDCQGREGYQLVAPDAEAPVNVFRSADADEGWAVTDWGFHTCLKHWVCAEECANVNGVVTCVPITLIHIGRWMPVTGAKCFDSSQQNNGQTFSDEGDSGGAYSSP